MKKNTSKREECQACLSISEREYLEKTTFFKDREIQEFIARRADAPEVGETAGQFKARVMNTVECLPRRREPRGLLRKHPVAVTVGAFSYAGLLLFCLLGGGDVFAAIFRLPDATVSFVCAVVLAIISLAEVAVALSLHFIVLIGTTQSTSTSRQ